KSERWTSGLMIEDELPSRTQVVGIVTTSMVAAIGAVASLLAIFKALQLLHQPLAGSLSGYGPGILDRHHTGAARVRRWTRRRFRRPSLCSSSGSLTALRDPSRAPGWSWSSEGMSRPTSTPTRSGMPPPVGRFEAGGTA